MATRKTIKGKTKTRYQIEFKISGRRHSLSLGSKYTEKQIDRIQLAVEEVVVAIETGGNISKATAAYIASMPDDLRGRFIAAGLLEEPQTGTLVSLWDMFEEHAEKMGHKDSTLKQYQTARKWFFQYFPEEQQTGAVTEKDAEEFNAWLHRQKNKYGNPISPRSVAGYVKTIKAVFNLARKARIIDRSPFEFIQKGSFANPARQFEVSADMVSSISDACSQGWRVLIVLWRFGGLRKMEPLLLKWEDILWDAGKIRVHSPKTARYAGHAERFCPLFPEIRRELTDLFEIQGYPGGAEYVLPGDIRERSENGIYNAVIRIVRRAGFTPWDRLINNMRATRDSELKRAGFTSDQRAAWLGHSEKVSKAHYQIGGMLVDSADYATACGFVTLPAEQDEKTTVKTTVEDSEFARLATEFEVSLPVD